ncbi:MAG: Dabb family protein [Actinobacteria bacterium]|nr:Dabb family protein [Actinomycetota bacterium]
MFHHIVLLRFTPESTPEQHRAVLEGLRALPDSITEIRTYEVHLDAGLGAQNAHISAHGAFDDEAAWRTYNDHPVHLDVLRHRILPILASAMRTQYSD